MTISRNFLPSHPEFLCHSDLVHCTLHSEKEATRQSRFIDLWRVSRPTVQANYAHCCHI